MSLPGLGMVQLLCPRTGMRTFAPLFFVIATAGSSQAPAAVTLPETLRAHVKDERFQIVASIRGLPLGVREDLQRLFGVSTLDIAEPGAEFQGTVANPKLPLRRLIAAGCSMDHCLVHYERSGSARTWHVALFHWTPAATRLEAGGIAPRRLASLDDVRKAMLSGAINGPPKVW